MKFPCSSQVKTYVYLDVHTIDEKNFSINYLYNTTFLLSRAKSAIIVAMPFMNFPFKGLLS